MGDDAVKKAMQGRDVQSSWLVCKHYFLARLRADIRDDLNARLQLFTDAAELALAQVTQQPQRCNTLPVWQHMLLCGVQDVWSRVRQVCIDGLDRLAHCLHKEEQTTTGKPIDNTHSPSDAVFIEYILVAWRSATAWYAKEGLLRLLALVPLGSTARRVLFTCALPALSEPQLPVREAAADLLVRLVAVNAQLACVAVDRIITTLESGLPCNDGDAHNAPLRTATVHHTEGCLLSLVQLCRKQFVRAEAPGVRRLLFHLAAHPASSVRQYVAEALAPPSPGLFGELVRRVSSALDERVAWQEQETLLMALLQHLARYCSHGAPAPLPPRRITATEATANDGGAHALEAEVMQATGLTALLNMAASTQFEVQRMALQVIPLYLQFCVRDSDAPCAAVLGITHTLLARLCNCDEVARGNRMAELVSELVLPSLWWYLAVRVAVQPDVLGSAQRAALRELHGSLVHIPRARQERFLAVLLILETYLVSEHGALYEGGEGAASMLNAEAWRVLICERQRHFDSLRFGTDFVPVVWLRLHRGAATLRLVPTWTAALSSVLTHQQCLLLAMVRQTMLAEFGQLGQASYFHFAYHAAFTAPAMLDGGEELALGYVWLRQHFATEAQLPSIASARATVEPDDGGSTSCEARGHDLRTPHYTAACAAICSDVFATVYGNAATEPVVLQEIRQLMVALCEVDGGHWRRVVVAAVVARLDAVAPTWCAFVRETEHSARPGVAVPESAHTSGADDDWDSSEDMDGQVMGSSVAEEVARARALLAQLRRCDVDGDAAVALSHEEQAPGETAFTAKLHSLIAPLCAE